MTAPDLDINSAPGEKALLRAVSGGDETAFRQLFDLYRQRIYSLAMYLTHSEVLSEEIVQDVFVKVWTHRDELVHLDFFNAWLRTIARNTISNYLRTLAREKLGLSNLTLVANSGNLAAVPVSPVPTGENSLQEKEYQQILQQAIERLSPRQKEAYLLSRQAGMKNNELADTMGVSVNTAKEYLKLALRSIRTYLDARIDLMIATAIALYLK